MQFKYLGGILACFMTMGVMIIVTAKKSDQKINGNLLVIDSFNHLFDWGLVYYFGVSINAIIFFIQKRKQQEGDQYTNLLYNAEIDEGKLKMIPKTVWLKLAVLEFSTSFLLVLSFIILTPFIFITIQSFQLIFSYLYVYNEYNLPIKRGSTMYGVILIVMGQIIAGISGIHTFENYGAVWVTIGFFILLVQIVLQTFYLIEKKKFIQQYYTQPSQVTSILGIITLLLWALGLIILQYIPCPSFPDEIQQQQCRLGQTKEFFQEGFQFLPIYGFFTFFVIIILAIPASLLNYQLSQESNTLKKQVIFNMFTAMMLFLFVIALPLENKLYYISLIGGLIIEAIGLGLIFNLFKLGDQENLLQDNEELDIEDESEVS